MNRRNVLTALIACVGMALSVPQHKLRSLFNRFKRDPWPDSETIETLSIVAEYIYPRNEGPGALDLGIKTFFTMQLGTDYYRQNMVRINRFAHYLNARADTLSHVTFARLDGGRQKKILDEISERISDRISPQIGEDFGYLIQVTLEGCFCSPRHGGNREKKAWHVLGGSFKEDWTRV
jgi:hypothetical protein